jgi:glycosyltransferase involved in cell wall biosynthesis
MGLNQSVMTLGVTHIIYFDDVASGVPLTGTENHLVELLKGLARKNVDVELIALIKRYNMRLESIFLDLDRHNVKVSQVHLGEIYDWRELLRTLYKMCAERRGRIIHTHKELASLYGRIAAFFARNAGIVKTHHDDNPDDAKGWKQLRLVLLDLITDMTIAISDNVRAFMINQIGIRPEKIETIYYGIKAPDLLFPKEESRQALEIPKDCFCVGFVGKLTRQKNIPLLFEAVKGLKDVKLCLIGTGEEEDYLKRRAQDMDVTNVIFAGGRDLAADYMTAFDLMVLPSRWEGLGLVLLEAMIRHVPVAGSKNGAIPETLGQGTRGFLFDDAAQLRIIIEQIKANPIYAAANETTAYQDVLMHYTINAMVDKTKRVYRAIVKDISDD